MIFTVIKSIFGVVGAGMLVLMGRDISKSKGSLEKNVNPITSFFIGFIADFFDALGVGSYAITISLNRVFKQIPDKLLPGTLTLGIGVIPTIVEACVSMSIISIDALTLLATTIAAGIGGWVGAKIISGFSESKVRIILGTLLIIVGGIQLYKLIANPADVLAGANGLGGTMLIVGALGTFIFGVLQAWGLGFFAPTLALFLMLGMNSRAIFPIMMSGACAGMLLSSFQFIKSGKYAKKATIYLAVGGIIGVIVALLLVKSLPLKLLSWIVMAILFYVGIEMLLKGLKGNKAEKK